MPLKYLFNIALQKRKIEINPDDWDIEYTKKKYCIDSKLIYFPVARIQDRQDKKVKVDLIIFEKIKTNKYYDTSILNVLN